MMMSDQKVVGPGLSGSVSATESMLCFTGPPLPEMIKLLAPLANLEELNLSDNRLGGTISADVAVFTKLKKLELRKMGLDGEMVVPVPPLEVRT